MNQPVRAVRAGQVLDSGVRQIVTITRAGSKALSTEDVISRLEEAGAALLAMQSNGYTTRMRQMRFDAVHAASEAYGWEASTVRPPTPTAAAITAMDEAFGWLLLIPEQSFLLRRVLGARALVHPITARHLFTWRRLAATLGADHKSVQRWHGNGIKIIVKALQQCANL